MTKQEKGSFKLPKQEFTVEFKELAVKRVTSGQSVGTAARELGVVMAGGNNLAVLQETKVAVASMAYLFTMLINTFPGQCAEQPTASPADGR